MSGHWLKRFLILALVSGMALWIGVHLDLIELSLSGIHIVHDGDLDGERDPVKRTEMQINRGDLYFFFFRYEDALRLYCRALFNEKPSFKVGYEYKAVDGEVDLSRIVEDYDLSDKAKMVLQVPETLYNVGICYTKLGKVKEAIMVYDAFILLFPNDPYRPLAERNAQDLRLNRL
jgi:tetratricopeptide (TPR) repeat protein